MKTPTLAISTHLSSFRLFMLAACLWFAPGVRAGLQVDIHLYHDTYGYYFYPWLSTTTNTPGFPNGNYMIASWQIPTNGSQLQYQATNNTLNFTTGGGNYYGDFNSYLYGITNAPWSIWVTNSTSTNQYKFSVTVGGLTSNWFGAPAVAVFPTNGAFYVTNQPLFQWTGASNWEGELSVSDYSIETNGNQDYEASSNLPPNQTSWPCPVVLPNGTNDFSVDYTSNATAFITASVPLNGAQPISAWTSTATMESHVTYDSLFTVGQPATLFGGHTNILYYSFEDDNLFAHDFSGHGNDVVTYSWFSVPPYMTNDAAAGNWAVGFSGGSWLNLPTNNPVTAFDPVATLGGSFSVSLWAKTTNNPGNDSDPADSGASLLSANSDQVIPMALTGSKLAFLTGGGAPDTLHSTASINTGGYVHLVVTRDQANGQKKIYVNGNLDASDFGASGTLTTASARNLFIGMNTTFSAGFIGDIDEVQIYSGLLSATDVTYLFEHPGTNVADTTGSTGPDFNAALSTAGLAWSTSGDTSWFVETTNTYNGVSAAQSGIVTNNQSSTLSVPVTGPGTLMFYWSSQGSGNNFDYECYLDGEPNNGYLDDISDVNSWYQDGPFSIPAGQHTLSWTIFAYGDDDPTEAGFLDEVSYVVASPVELSNPQIVGANFQFQFLSEAGYSHNILYRTNLVVGNWLTNTTVAGDGTLKTISVPLSLFSPAKQGFIRVSTQ